MLATIIGFLGSACGTVGGVGGGGIFVPMLTLIVGFDTKSAAAISKCNKSPILMLVHFLFDFNPNFIQNHSWIEILQIIESNSISQPLEEYNMS